MKLRYLSTFLLCFTFYSLYSQSLDWVISYGGEGRGFVKDVVVNNNRSMYMVGHFIGAHDFAPGTDVLEFLSDSYDDIFIQKIDSTGKLEWVNTIDNGNSLRTGNPISIAKDIDENIYISGVYYDTVDFDLGPGSDIRIENGEGDCFILKLNQNGEKLWVKNFWN